MPDITMCDGKGCESKDNCYRHTARPGYWQSWFSEAPGVDEDCPEYWPLKNERGEDE